jgi:type IV secretory pathway VirB10-like protein
MSESFAPLQEGELDPHAPKLSPDDPRLGLARPRARTLRTGPIALLMGCLLVAIVLALALAFQPPASKSKAAAEPTGAPAPPTIPDAIRNAEANHPPPAEAKDAARPVPNARAEAAVDDPALRAARELDQKARGASIFFESAGGVSDREVPSPAPTAPRTDLAGSEGAAPSAATSSLDSDPNLQDRKNAFLDGKGAGKAEYLAATVQHPKSPYEIQAGTILPAVLITAINSDLPGPVVAQVREHVYDSVSGEHLLVPQGSRLLAQYDSMVAWGQERILVCWNRLILPNGDSITLGCMPGADLEGAAGVSDGVDEHWWRILKGASVATLLSATSVFAAGNTSSYNPTVGQMMARGAAGEVSDVGQQLTRSDLTIQPTLTVRPGFSVNVIVTKDIVLSPYPSPPMALELAR